MMSKNLVIVESPTKTKTISKLLGKNYQVLASKGHLRDLPKSQFGLDIENNFEPKYINVRGKGKTINELKKACKNSDTVYLATDPDREGEAISWHLQHLLQLDPEAENRVAFNEITADGVKNGMAHPRKIDGNLVDAQQARRVMDRIVGYEISPILWKKVKSGLSAGRVQSVALKLVVDREREIDAFEPQEYWTVHALHNKDGISFHSDFQGFLQESGKLEKKKLENKAEAEDLRTGLKKPFRVGNVSRRQRSRKPFPPFTTSTLQQEASRRLGFSTSKTMMIAQQLYEGIHLKRGGQVGLITYMRTDSTRLSHQFTGQTLAYITKNFGEEYSKGEISYAGKKQNSQDAHEGIRPTEASRSPQSIRGDLSDDQLKLYDLIWRRAIASQMSPSKTMSTSVDLLSERAVFRAKGLQALFDGFERVWYSTDKEELLPSLKKGEEVDVLRLEKKQHFTQPPARYSEASLVATLEKNGIGRPSTYSSIIRSILSRRYVEMEKKQFVPTRLGKNVNEFLEKNFPDIINVSFTASMEEKLDHIAEGKVPWKELMAHFYEIFSKDLAKAKKDATSYKIPDEKTGEKCPVCGHELVIKHGRNGKFIGCSNFPACTYTRSIVKTIGVKCPQCGGELVEKVSKRGKVFYGCSNYPKCDFACWDKPTGETCPECGSLLLHKKNRREDRIYCSNEDCPRHND